MHVKLLKQFKNICFLRTVAIQGCSGSCGASYSVRLSPDQAVLVQALVGDIALCS